ncbi:hypothetical protein V500_01736 [Pseudogymnoascus sp. VKM F-4518 (FW-2643)]|nr:hypothetical protein V500_01736 [Pseudogymnoascus sp. VKM F-4518 (FW-2643)]
MSSKKTIVLITGSNGGIGYLTAESLAASSPDYHVIVCSRNQERGEKALQDIQKKFPKGSFSLVRLDVTDPKSVTDAAALVSRDFGRLDVLVNNAGVIPVTTPFLQELRETFETNTFGAAIVSEAFVPLLEKSKNARLIYISSELGSITERSDPSGIYYKVPTTAYRMSKAALNMLMMCHHVELRPKGVKVWAFNPGYVVTDLSGTGEAGRQERIANGAGDPRESAEGILACIDGRRDADVGKFVNKSGFHSW